MEKSGADKRRKIRGERRVSAVALSTLGANERLAKKLEGFRAKLLARRAGGVSTRTAENWLAGENGPGWKSTVAMLNDPELAPIILRAAGRDDLARQHEILSFTQKIEALKAAEDRHEEEAHGIRQSLEMGGARSSLDRGPPKRKREAVEKDRRMVSRSTQGSERR